MKIPTFLKLKTKKQRILAGVILIILVIIIGKSFTGKDTEEETKKQKIVEIARVFDIANSTTDLPVVGTVESQSEAILRSEAQGEVSRVNKKLGDSVYSGELIAEIKNSSQRADVLRAQGVLDAANANLLKVQNNSSQAESLIKSSIFSAYSTSLDAVKNKVDQFITDPDSANPKVNVSIGDPSGSYFERQEIEIQRVVVGDVLDSWSSNAYDVNSVDSSSLLQERFNESKSNLELTRDFLILVANTINETKASDGITQATVDKYKSDVSVAISNVNGSLSSLISAYNSYSSQINLGQDSQDILAAKAQVTQARAGLLSAQASLEKTIIRSPITGVINAIDIKQGDVVNQLQEVGEVIGNGELEIIAFVNDIDRESIFVGSKVVIEDKYNGEVIRIAPAVNSNTQKVEVRISISGEANIRNGETISLSIKREAVEKNKDTITVPLTAIKITGDSSKIFKVNFNNEIEAIEVVSGNILGDRIVIESGLDLNDIIVIDARGLKEGDIVSIK